MNLKELWIFESDCCVSEVDCSGPVIWVYEEQKWSRRFMRIKCNGTINPYVSLRNILSFVTPAVYWCVHINIYVDPEAASFLLACLLNCGWSCTRRILIELRRRYRSMAIWQQCIKLTINKVKLHITLSPPPPYHQKKEIRPESTFYSAGGSNVQFIVGGGACRTERVWWMFISHCDGERSLKRRSAAV